MAGACQSHSVIGDSVGVAALNVTLYYANDVAGAVVVAVGWPFVMLKLKLMIGI
jgi:hypothetical protein